jgi:hypothetical protein
MIRQNLNFENWNFKPFKMGFEDLLEISSFSTLSKSFQVIQVDLFEKSFSVFHVSNVNLNSISQAKL